MAGRNNSGNDVQVYVPYRAGLPPIGPYFRDLWSRRQFAAEFSRSGIRSANTQTFFGQLWLVLNPLLLALVYFILVSILRQVENPMNFLGYLTGGLFLYFFINGTISTGASSVTGGGGIIMNMAFPRLLMPLAAVRTAFIRFLPTIPVMLIIRALGDREWNWVQLTSIVFVLMAVVFSAGLAAIMATLNVYFRDTTSFLPYFLRIWLYLSPVLWAAFEIDKHGVRHLGVEAVGNWIYLNPLFSIIGGFSESAIEGRMPPAETWIYGSAWAVFFAVTGFLFLMSRERDFAVRII